MPIVTDRKQTATPYHTCYKYSRYATIGSRILQLYSQHGLWPLTGVSSMKSNPVISCLERFTLVDEQPTFALPVVLLD